MPLSASLPDARSSGTARNCCSRRIDIQPKNFSADFQAVRPRDPGPDGLFCQRFGLTVSTEASQTVRLSPLNEKLEFGGQGPQPMRYGSVGSPVSTGRRSKRDRAILGSERQFPIYHSEYLSSGFQNGIPHRVAGGGWKWSESVLLRPSSFW